MIKTKWRELAELVGIAAIVASLIFVGLQLKQSQDIAIAGQYHERTALTVQNFNSELENGDLRIWARAFRDVEFNEEISIEDKGRAFLRLATYIMMLDNHYYQYQAGFLDDEAWQTHISGLRDLAARLPEVRYFIQNRVIPVRPTFWEAADEVLAEIEAARGSAE